MTPYARDIGNALGQNPVQDFLTNASKVAKSVSAGAQQVDKMAAQTGKAVTQAAALARQVVDNPVGALIKRITFLSTVSPTVSYTGADLVKEFNAPPDPNSAGKRIGKLLKPTFTLETVTGTYTLAPYGEASPEDFARNKSKLMLMAGATVFGLMAIGFGLGRLSKRSPK